MITRIRDKIRRTKTYPDHIALLSSLDYEPQTFNQSNQLPQVAHGHGLIIGCTRSQKHLGSHTTTTQSKCSGL
jgi:hypothetical protein